MKIVRHPSNFRPGETDVVAIYWSNGDRSYGAPSRVGEAFWHFVLRLYVRRVRRRRSLRA
jgi:hypothetical protein